MLFELLRMDYVGTGIMCVPTLYSELVIIAYDSTVRMNLKQD